MSNAIVNLTVPIAVEHIESTLETYPLHPHRQFFAHPDIRRRLVAYVLSHFPNVYDVVDNSTSAAVRSGVVGLSPQKQAQLDHIICRGIQQIMQEHFDILEHSIPECEDGEDMPSHWFG